MKLARVVSKMRIGIEVNHRNLRCDLLWHPERYFFILMADSCASLCIRTCDATGENIQMHIIDGLSLSDEGGLYSVFAYLINDAISKRKKAEEGCSQRDEFPLTPNLVRTISRMPDLVDWILNTIITNKRNLVVYDR
jgi:hypothetical protein